MLNSIIAILAMQANGAVPNSALNDLAAQLTSLSVSVSTNRNELAQVKAVVDYAGTILNTITVTTDNSDGYHNATSALNTLKISVKNFSNDNTDNPDIIDDTDNSVTPTPSAAPNPTSKKPTSQMNYREDTLTVEDVKSWNWEEGGTIQIGGQFCEFGKSKINGMLWIHRKGTRPYKTTDAEIVVAKDQWEDLPVFKYGEFKYKTYFYYKYMLKRTTSMTLSSSDPYRPIAQAGDTFIDKNGKKTKLTSIKYKLDVVVGYGQKLDLYSGMEYEDRVLEPGDVGITWYGNEQYRSDDYIVASNGEGHFSWDWYVIWCYEASLAKKIKKPKKGQICGYWTQYNAKLKKWEWIGPDF